MRTYLVALLALALVGPAGLAAQAPPPAAPPAEGGPGQAANDLVFEREVFSYPQFQRRNPFRSLLGDSETGPRYEGMSLVGIVFSPSDPSQSLAMLRAGGGGNAPPTSMRLRPGERWGNLRVLEVRREEVLVEVQEFGLTEQRIMVLPTRGQGGS